MNELNSSSIIGIMNLWLNKYVQENKRDQGNLMLMVLCFHLCVFVLFFFVDEEERARKREPCVRPLYITGKLKQSMPKASSSVGEEGNDDNNNWTPYKRNVFSASASYCSGCTDIALKWLATSAIRMIMTSLQASDSADPNYVKLFNSNLYVMFCSFVSFEVHRFLNLHDVKMPVREFVSLQRQFLGAQWI